MDLWKQKYQSIQKVEGSKIGRDAEIWQRQLYWLLCRNSQKGWIWNYSKLQIHCKKSLGMMLEYPSNQSNRGVSKISFISSKEHKREMFLHLIPGLTVHIVAKSLVKTIKREISKKCGKLNNNQWAVMKYGSRLRFFPILHWIVKIKGIYTTCMITFSNIGK